jgi:hypothetical protein
MDKKPTKQFPPSVKKRKQFDVPHRVITHLTRECGGNVHDRHIVDVICGSFEKETEGANPHLGSSDNHPTYAAKNAADLETDSRFVSAYCNKEKKYSAHAEQLDMLRFQGEEDCANTLHNPHK